ncbi:MAG: hypothetical protein ACLQG5_06395 [Methanobacterium sp.]
MEINHGLTINNVEMLLLLQINERVKLAFDKLDDEYSEFSKSDIESLKIDKNSLENDFFKANNTFYITLSRNLIPRIDYILDRAKI